MVRSRAALSEARGSEYVAAVPEVKIVLTNDDGVRADGLGFLASRLQDLGEICGAHLAEGKPTRVEAGGAPVLLFRSSAGIQAVGARCSHAGGPLEEGEVDAVACTVECPWHHSVFRFENGEIEQGPATAPQPAFEARVSDGKVEVRPRQG